MVVRNEMRAMGMSDDTDSKEKLAATLRIALNDFFSNPECNLAAFDLAVAAENFLYGRVFGEVRGRQYANCYADRSAFLIPTKCDSYLTEKGYLRPTGQLTLTANIYGAVMDSLQIMKVKSIKFEDLLAAFKAARALMEIDRGRGEQLESTKDKFREDKSPD
jgi:hypothetical protein